MQLLLGSVALMALSTLSTQQTITRVANYKREEVHASGETNETVSWPIWMEGMPTQMQRNTQNSDMKPKGRRSRSYPLIVRKTQRKQIEAIRLGQGTRDLSDLCGYEIVFKEGDTVTFTDDSLRGKSKTCKFSLKRKGEMQLSLKCSQFELSPCKTEYLRVKDFPKFCNQAVPYFTLDREMVEVKYRSEKSESRSSTGCKCTVLGSKPLVGARGDRDVCKNCGRSPKISSSRIVAGHEARPGDHPWIAYLEIGESAFCAGSLITDKLILTAAHCLYLPAEQITAVLGMHNVYRNGAVAIRGQESILHPKYQAGRGDSPADIALLRLEQAAPLDGIRIGTICLGLDKDVKPGDIVNAAGWGHDQSGGQPASALMEVDLDVISTSECSRLYRNRFVISKDMVCTYSLPRDSCQGDSGGPIIIQTKKGYWVLVGIISFGYRCAYQDSPGVNTRVSAFSDWIMKYVTGKDC